MVDSSSSRAGGRDGIVSVGSAPRKPGMPRSTSAPPTGSSGDQEDGRPPLSPATFDEHEGDTIDEHRFVNVLSPSWSSR